MKSYECATCGVITHEKDHLCEPRELTGRHDYCGETMEGASQMCEPINKAVEYECGSCGRPAETPEMVCKPTRRHE